MSKAALDMMAAYQKTRKRILSEGNFDKLYSFYVRVHYIHHYDLTRPRGMAYRTERSFFSGIYYQPAHFRRIRREFRMWRNPTFKPPPTQTMHHILWDEAHRDLRKK